MIDTTELFIPNTYLNILFDGDKANLYPIKLVTFI